MMTYYDSYSRAEIKLAFEANKFEQRPDGRIEVCIKDVVVGIAVSMFIDRDAF